MNKMCLAHLGLFLLALLFLTSEVVQAQNTTAAPTSNSTLNITMTTKDKSSCGRTEAFTLLLPLAVASSLLYGCF